MERQLDGHLGLEKIQTLDQVDQALRLIKRQGEGSDTSPEDTGPKDLSHYYRFGEMYHGKRLQKDPVLGTWAFSGADVPMPDAWPVAAVPVGGYRQADVAPEVWALLDSFDRDYTTMLGQLALAWQNGSQESLDDSVNTMQFGLGDAAVALMKLEIPAGNGNYGPCFRVLENP